MNEEDVMEISIMHLYIPYYTWEEGDRLILPSDCSLSALTILLNETVDTECPYHFPLYDINEQPSNVVIIRNLPYAFYVESRAGYELKKRMIKRVGTIRSINQAISKYSTPAISYGVVKVTLHNSEDAVNVAQEIDGREFHGMCLSASVKGKKREEKKEGEGGVEGM